MWDEVFEEYWAARGTKGGTPRCQAAVKAGRALLQQRGRERYDWLRRSLRDEQRKWFAAAVLESQTVPKALLEDLVRAGVYEPNPSRNRQFLEPVVRSVGSVALGHLVLRYLMSGTDDEKAGAASAFYWCFCLSSEGPVDRPDLEALQATVRERMLVEFVHNENLDVRRRILPMLVLREGAYAVALRPLVQQAIAIARGHADSYIRHRVEVQLTGQGPFQPLPVRGRS